MKRILLLSAIILMSVFTVFAQSPTSKVNANKVRMHRQPAVNTEVMRTLTADDKIVVVRQVSPDWSLVQIDGEGGYVLNTYLAERKNKKGILAKRAKGTANPTANASIK